MVRRALVLLLVGLAPFGCAIGGANDDTIETRRDALDLPEDDADGESDAAEDETLAEDAPLEDTSAPVEDTEPLADAIFPPEDTGCTAKCTTCGGSDGCGGKCLTGSCGPGETCVAGSCIAPTRSHLSPSDYAFGSAWARGITWTIGSEAPATIRYTLDGSTPGPTSAGKASPADLFLSSSPTIIKWYADNGAKEPTIHSFTASILTSGQATYGFIAEKTNLGGKGPVVVVSPGATVTGSTSYQAWTSSGCAACGMQLVYGIGTTSAGCAYHGSPYPWPGATGTGAISVKAPTAPGTYSLNVSWTLQNSCADAMATNPLGVRATSGIATIVVR